MDTGKKNKLMLGCKKDGCWKDGWMDNIWKQSGTAACRIKATWIVVI